MSTKEMCSGREAPGYAVLTPVGPTRLEVERMCDLFESLCAYEPDVSLCVLIDDSPEDRHLEAIAPLPTGCEIVSMVNPRRGLGDPCLGGQCASILSALKIIQDRGAVEFVIKLDTDALVIAPFSNSVNGFLVRHPGAGMIGTVGRTCRRDAPDYGWEARTVPSLIVGAQQVTDELLSQARNDNGVSDIVGFGPMRAEGLGGFATIRHHVRRAMDNGYSTLEYCQGGAYVLSFETVTRMAQMGFLDCALDWAWLPVAEDVMMGMYTRSVGLKVMDFSNHGEPFGTQHQGLPYSLPEILNRGHAVIHSVKNDRNYSEVGIREYFWRIRSFRDGARAG